MTHTHTNTHTHTHQCTHMHTHMHTHTHAGADTYGFVDEELDVYLYTKYVSSHASC